MSQTAQGLSNRRFSIVTWDQLSKQDLYSLMQLRQAVFVVEQQCVYLDADGLDPFSQHCLFWDQRQSPNVLAASARIVPPLMRYNESSIGRVVSAKAYRDQGFGRQLMQTVLAHCDQAGTPKIRISAQAYLQKFYTEQGFNVVSEPYDEDGIAHIEMLRDLPTAFQTPDRLGPIEFVPLKAEHARALFEVLAPVVIYQFMEERPQDRIETMQVRYARLALGAPKDCGQLWLNWLVRDSQTQQAMGTVQATVMPNAQAEIGYVLGSTFWGSGLGTQCVQWLNKMLHSRYGVQHVWAQIDVRNIASWRAAERSGMRRVQEVDSELLGIATRDYRYVSTFAPTADHQSANHS